MKLNLKIISLIVFGLLSALAKANYKIENTLPEMSVLEDSMKSYATFIQLGKTDEEKNEANDKFKLFLEKALNSSESFTYPFDSLKSIAKLTSPDKQIRIYNWVIPYVDGSFAYCGYIQKKVGRKKFIIYPLIDKSEENSRGIDMKVLSNYQWYGSLYYKIIQPKKRINKTYVLLGWDGNDRTSNKKLIDVFYFDEKKEPKFGLPVFKLDKKAVNRIIFEYNEGASMSLRYEEDKNTIIYDHLEPSHPQLVGQYQFYGPDFSYDSLKYKKGFWNLIKDVTPLNSPTGKEKNYNAPK